MACIVRVQAANRQTTLTPGMRAKIARMPARLPPLNAVRAFVAAARHQSFTRAAAELHVTRRADPLPLGAPASASPAH